MKSNIKKLFKITTNYQISQGTGIAQTTLGRYTSGNSKVGNMKLDHAITLNNYYNKLKGDINMKTYTNYYTINLEIMNELEEEVQKLVYNVRNSDLDFADKVEIDALEWLVDEVDNEIQDAVDNNHELSDITEVEYTRINKDTNMNEIVQLSVEVTEIEEDETYKVVAKSVKAWNESM